MGLLISEIDKIRVVARLITPGRFWHWRIIFAYLPNNIAIKLKGKLKIF